MHLTYSLIHLSALFTYLLHTPFYFIYLFTSTEKRLLMAAALASAAAATAALASAAVAAAAYAVLGTSISRCPILLLLLL